MCGFNILPGSACRPERILLTLQWCSTVTQSTRSFVDFPGVNTDCSGLWYISMWSRIRLESEQERCMWSIVCLCVCAFMCVLYSTICVCVCPREIGLQGFSPPCWIPLDFALDASHCVGGHGTQAGRSFPASTTPSQQDPQLASVIKWDGR